MSRAGRIIARRHALKTNHERPRSGLFVRAIATVIAAFGITSVFAVAMTAVIGATAVGVLSVDLPDPKRLDTLTFAQPTVVLDRTGKVELTRFQRVQRRVVTYDQVPRLVLDSATTAEDRTFWTNGGFDGTAILSAIAEGASGGDQRGASTITQQLVRARLLPEGATGPSSDVYIRKAKELIQAIHVTEAFPGQAGKQQIITAYLNEIFYGHGAYGIAAAAQAYFGVTDLAKLTPAQAALLAGLPKSPTTLDPYNFAKPDAKGRLVVPPDSPPAERRDWILNGLATEGGRWTHLSTAQLQAALAEPIILAGDKPLPNKTGQFTWQVRRELDGILGDPQAADTGGYTVITTLDWQAQQLAERWMTAAAIVPNLPARQADRLLTQLKIPAGDRSWVNALRGKDLHNGALVALDYQTGDVLAYIGSAGYSRDDLASRKFAPKYDAAGDGLRQPGSAFKPILYTSAFDNERLTPGSLLLDVATKFNVREDWSPHDADQLDRGPVLVRQALQYSLNVPAIRALQRVGNEAVARTADALGLPIPRRRQRVPAGGTRWSARHGRGPAARPRLGLRRHRQRRRARPAAHDPQGHRSRRTYRLAGGRPDRETGRLPASGLPDDRHPRRKHGPEPEPDLVRQTRVEERSARDASAGCSEDGHVERSDRSLDVRVPASARITGPARTRGRHLDGEQRSLQSEDRDARDVTDGTCAAVARLRA